MKLHSAVSLLSCLLVLVVSVDGATVSRVTSLTVSSPHGEEHGHEHSGEDEHVEHKEHGEHSDHDGHAAHNEEDDKDHSVIPDLDHRNDDDEDEGGVPGESEHTHEAEGHGHDGQAESHGHTGHGKEHSDYGHGVSHAHAESDDQVAFALAVMLLGTVGWVMSLFYFVNYPDEDVRNSTWDTLSSMVAIFSAVLIFSAAKEIFIHFMGGEGNHHGPPSTEALVGGFVRFFVMFGFVQYLCWHYKSRLYAFSYCVGIGAHVVGFAAIDAFGTMLTTDFFSESVGHCLAGITISMVALYGVNHVAWMLKERSDGSELWKEACNESESESIGLCMGLLFSMVLRMAITGALPPVHGSPRYKTHSEVLWLMGISIGLTPLVMGTRVVRSIYASHESPIVKRMIGTLQESLSMTMGWCLLFWGYWQFYSATANEGVGAGGQMSQRVIMALVFSAFVFASIIGIDFIADRSTRVIREQHADHMEKALRALLKTLALLMGLSWESAFTVAVRSVAVGFPHDMRHLVTIVLTIILCLTVLPAWALYIWPKSSVAREMEESMEKANEKAAYEDGIKHTATA